MIIAISNPSRQHTHRVVEALAKGGTHEVIFLTSFWFMPETIVWHKWLKKIPGIKGQVSKKSSDVVDDKIVITHWTGILFSFFGRFFYKGEKRSFIEDKIHDRWVANWVGKKRPDILIGYEKSCLRSFRAVKGYGGTTLLDLAQVHASFIEKLRAQYSFFRTITGSDALFYNVSERKKEEYNLLPNNIVRLP